MSVKPSERDLLIRIDERVADLHTIVKGSADSQGLVYRVDSLESSRDQAEGAASMTKKLAAIGTGGGMVGFLTALWHWLHQPK